MGKESGEKHLLHLLGILEGWKAEEWTPRLNDILDSFEDFLMTRPEPPKEWLDRYGEHPEKFDYYQVVLPEDFQDPFEDDLGNIRRLRDNFAETNGTLALEHQLVSRNYFIFENGHAETIPAPRPILMLESDNDDDGKLDWDCCISVFADGSFYAYNLDNDYEEILGENVKDILENKMDVLSKMNLVIPVEGRDYGVLKSV